jgi:hypothetical protein
MAGEFEKLAYEAALRGLDKQEGLLEELRTRTGVLLAASSLAASFLGQQAFQHPSPRGLAITALVAFVVSIAASVFILLPKKNLIFAGAPACTRASTHFATICPRSIVASPTTWTCSGIPTTRKSSG